MLDVIKLLQIVCPSIAKMFALVVGTSSVSQEMFLVDELFCCLPSRVVIFREKLFRVGITVRHDIRFASRSEYTSK